jgi:hypothetical protein
VQREQNVHFLPAEIGIKCNSYEQLLERGKNNSGMGATAAAFSLPPRPAGRPRALVVGPCLGSSAMRQPAPDAAGGRPAPRPGRASRTPPAHHRTRTHVRVMPPCDPALGPPMPASSSPASRSRHVELVLALAAPRLRVVLGGDEHPRRHGDVHRVAGAAAAALGRAPRRVRPRPTRQKPPSAHRHLLLLHEDARVTAAQPKVAVRNLI